METINSGLTRTAVSERLNVSQAFISQLCSGGKTPSDRTIADICREFNISEVWLRTGEGEPHMERDKDEEFLEIMEKINISDDDLIKRIIKAYWFLDDDEKAAVKKMIDNLSGK